MTLIIYDELFDLYNKYNDFINNTYYNLLINKKDLLNINIKIIFIEYLIFFLQEYNNNEIEDIFNYILHITFDKSYYIINNITHFNSFINIDDFIYKLENVIIDDNDNINMYDELFNNLKNYRKVST